MSVRDLLISLLRRWYLVLAGVAATAGLAVAVLLNGPVSYEMRSTVLLLPPDSSVGSRGNPYLYLGGLAQAVEVLAARMNTTQIRGPIEQAHPQAEFDVGQDQQATGPILALAVTSTDEQDAQQVTAKLLASVPETLLSMQEQLDVPGSSRISSLILTPDAEVELVTKTRDRAVLTVAGAGIALTVLGAGLVDGLLLGRITVRRRLEAAGAVADPAAGAEPTPEPTPELEAVLESEALPESEQGPTREVAKPSRADLTASVR